ncbi:MAG: phosphoenolpyruvate--protein phosphotransferase [Oscillospiraceae bacterium]
MTELHGKGVSKGIAIGRSSFYQREKICINQFHSDDSKEEISRFRSACDITLSQLDELYKRALTQVGEDEAIIFNIHKMILDDSDYVGSVEKYITEEHLSAEYAVALTSESFASVFAAVESEYLRCRGADIKDVSDRLMKNLMNMQFSNENSEHEHIIFSDDLAPSETIGLDRSKVLAFCTAFGSSTSHTAILARTMKIPAVVGLGADALNEDFNGKDVIVDGTNGVIYIDPDEKTRTEMTRRRRFELEREKLLRSLVGCDNVTADGRRINVYANIGSIDELADVAACDAGGIGLFRSEFLFLNGCSPREESQFRCYRTVLKKMNGKPVIIRTADLGADKQPQFMEIQKEDNPALGFRSIRISLTNKDDFKVQLRALYRASVYGSLSIMFPMITSVEEIREVKDILKEVKQELSAEGVPYSNNVPIGIMIETPAAVMISDLLAQEVDFFSIGTNDLTQYTLAVDRQNSRLEKFCNPHHTAILRMIKMTADNAHKHGAWIGICGELSSDTELTQAFLEMGIDELSTSPQMVLPLRDKIRRTDLSKSSSLQSLLCVNN